MALSPNLSCWKSKPQVPPRGLGLTRRSETRRSETRREFRCFEFDSESCRDEQARKPLRLSLLTSTGNRDKPLTAALALFSAGTSPNAASARHVHVAKLAESFGVLSLTRSLVVVNRLESLRDFRYS